MKSIAIMLLAVLLLGGMALDRHSMRQPETADAYYARVREAAEVVPARIEDWVGSDLPPSQWAIGLLKPNVYVHKRFQSVVNGAEGELTFIHCGDAYDMVHHYPPICYPYQGWKLMKARQRDWKARELPITGTEYEFALETFGRSQRIVVANCMIMPGGVIGRDMDAVESAAEDIERRLFGAAQVQMVFDETVEAKQRDAAVEGILNGYRPLIDAIRSDPTR